MRVRVRNRVRVVHSVRVMHSTTTDDYYSFVEEQSRSLVFVLSAGHLLTSTVASTSSSVFWREALRRHRRRPGATRWQWTFEQSRLEEEEEDGAALGKPSQIQAARTGTETWVWFECLPLSQVYHPIRSTTVFHRS